MAKFEERLAPYKDDYRLVGICWRSGKLDPVRNLSYTMLDEWGEVLQTQGFKFVNLQYGECEAELKEAEEKYGIEILRWPDLNLRNDLDDIFALMACLDAVASVQTAVLTMAGCAGAPSVGVKAGGWTAFGEPKSSCWFGKNKNIRKVGDVLSTVLDLRAKEFVYELFDHRVTGLSLSLRAVTATLDNKYFRDLTQKIISQLEQTSLTRANKILIGEVINSATETNYEIVQPAVDCFVRSGLLFRGTRANQGMARSYLSLGRKAGKEGDWAVADRALQVVEDLDQKLHQLSLPEFAWRKFLDGKLSEATDLAIKALHRIDWPTAVKFNLPRLLAESGDYQAAFLLAELSLKNNADSKGVFSEISQSALTDSKWELILDASERESNVAPLNLISLVLKHTAILRLHGFSTALSQMKLQSEKLERNQAVFFSTLALLNMHHLSEDDFFTLVESEKKLVDRTKEAGRAEMIYLELEDEVDRVDAALKAANSSPTIKSVLFYDLCLASLIRGRKNRAWTFISQVEGHRVHPYVLQNVISKTKRNLKEAETALLGDYRKGQNFSRNGFLLLDYFRSITNTEKLLGLGTRDIQFRRNADLGWFCYGIKKVDQVRLG